MLKPQSLLTCLLSLLVLVVPPALVRADEPASPRRPPTLELNDPMLEPIPEATQVVRDWRKALRLLEARDSAEQIARAEVEKARGFERQALAPALPQIDMTGSVLLHLLRKDVTVNGPTGPLTATLPESPNLSGEISVAQLVLGPRVWHGVGTASKRVDLATMQVEDRKRQLVILLARAAISVLSAEKVSERNKESLRATLVRADLERRRIRAGAGAEINLIRFDQEVLAARTEVVLADAEVSSAREQLGLILGSTEPWGVASDVSLEALGNSVLRTCEPAQLEDRPDRRALVLQREIAQRGVTDADLRYSPTGQVVGTLTVANQDFASGDPVALAVRGILTFPLWDGGERYGARRSASAELAQTEERLVALDRQVKVEGLQATRAVRVAAASLEIAQQARALAAENRRLSELAFDGGDGTSFDLVDAIRRLREAELTVVVREVGLLEARLADALALAKCNY